MSTAILLEIAVKSSVVLLLAWTATRVMARAAAATRHVVWVAALAAILVLPGLVAFGPAWHARLMPSNWTAAASLGIGPKTSAAGPRADAEVWPAIPSPRSHAPITVNAAGRSAAGPGGRFLRSSAATGNQRWPTLVAVVWAVGAVLGILNLLLGLLWTASFTRRAEVVSEAAWLTSLDEAQALMKLAGGVRLLMSDRVGVPVACGIVRPAVVLPSDADTWDAERRRVVLLHELAHVKRHDCLVQAFAHLAWAVHWVNPLALVAISGLRAEQERACDDLVLRLGTPAAEYAGHLCEIANTARRMFVPLSATLAIARPSRLEARVTAILDEARSRRAASWRFCLAMAGVLCLGVVPLGALRASTAAQAIAILPSAALSAITPYSLPVSVPVPIHGPSYAGEAANSAALAAVSAMATALPRLRPPAQALTTQSGRAFLESCVACHNNKQRTANLALDELDAEHASDHPEIWEKVVRRLRTGLHPSAGQPRPGRAAADAFSASIEETLDRADRANWGPGVAEPLTDLEVATRLAKFLWNREPDDTLMALASQGTLRNPSTLEQQVRRMIADPRSAAMLTGFFGDWLHIKNLAFVKPDAKVFPDFDDQLRTAFARETELFLASQVREDHSLIDLLAADYTFLNERLAAHYGISKITGSEFRRVTLTDGAPRGLLGQASILSVTSLPTRTSPVVRGKWLMETWLGVSPPPPPPNVPALKDDPDHPATMRALMEQHRKNPVCASCHVTMDQLGFALENFDAIGRWRNAESDLTIDASATLPDGLHFDGPVQLRGALLDRQDAIASTITLKLLAYALGRPARYSDMPAVRAIDWDAAPGHYKWSSTIAGIVKSAPFQMKRIE